MTSMLRKLSPAQIDEAASEWLLRREAGLTPGEREEYEQWLAADGRHMAAIERAGQAWALLDRPREVGRSHEMIHALGRRATRRRRRRVVGAVIALAAAVVVGVQWNPLRGPGAHQTTAIVAAAEKRVLPDGGLVELKPGAELSVDYSGELRRVTLRSGEALFHVAENKQRPFVVTAQGVQVRAVGTAFLVSMANRQVDVVVTQGTVAVDHPSPAVSGDRSAGNRFEPIFVDAGNRVTVDLASDAAALPVLPISPDEIEARLDWRALRVTFSGTALGEALSLINQHARVHLVIDDPELARMPVNGVFRVDNTETLIQLLEAAFEVHAERSNDTIILRRAK